MSLFKQLSTLTLLPFNPLHADCSPRTSYLKSEWTHLNANSRMRVSGESLDTVAVRVFGHKLKVSVGEGIRCQVVGDGELTKL